GGDLGLEGGPLVFFAEGFVRRTNPGQDSTGADPPAYTSWGAWAQVGVLLYRRLFDAAVRFNYVDPNTVLDHDRLIAGEAQAGYYIDGPRLVLRFRYGIGDQASPGSDHLNGTSLPVSTPGTYNIFTLQLNLAL